ncbi:MAG TPA: hypothetical protein DCP90_07835 [Clostridiales bacterium]|nr:MAG: hypothetical protein A2Y22_06030 [Clostridiales bacterium GWD2_32_59]HAN10509.1 hypothetical protein [Clostridiales bacterium]
MDRIVVVANILGDGAEEELGIIGDGNIVDEFYNFPPTQEGKKKLYDKIDTLCEGTEIVMADMKYFFYDAKQLLELLDYSYYKRKVHVTFVKQEFSTLNASNRNEITLMRMVVTINQRFFGRR